MQLCHKIPYERALWEAAKIILEVDPNACHLMTTLLPTAPKKKNEKVIRMNDLFKVKDPVGTP